MVLFTVVLLGRNRCRSGWCRIHAQNRGNFVHAIGCPYLFVARVQPKIGSLQLSFSIANCILRLVVRFSQRLEKFLSFQQGVGTDIMESLGRRVPCALLFHGVDHH